MKFRLKQRQAREVAQRKLSEMAAHTVVQGNHKYFGKPIL